MTKNQSLFFRFLLFLAGAGIVILAFFLTKGDRELNRIDAFTWTSIGFMYLIFFLPFFFTSINIANFSGKIPKMGLVWIGIFFYIAASLIVILLLAFLHIISLNTAIIIQAILLFLFLLNIFLAFYASSHAKNVVAEEAGKQQYINQIKPKAQVLNISVNRLPAEYENNKKIIKQTLEDIRYIYPVNSGAGDDLEIRIIKSLETLSEICSNISTGAQSATLGPEAENLARLVKERKLLRN